MVASRLLHNSSCLIGLLDSLAFSGALPAAASSSPLPTLPRAQVTLLPVIQSVEELMKLSIKELKGMLTDRNISMAGAAEKADLASLLKEKAGQVS